MHPMLSTAVKAARRAGSIINRGARDLDRLTITTKGPKDFVSEVDRAAEAAIVETLLATYPDHAILAEEGTAKDANADAEYLWIIDPLDGTTNFLHGFPQYCVSIAVRHKGQVTQGVVYDPVRNDLFTATRGRGAFLNDHRMRVSRRQHLKDGLIGTGFPYRDGSGFWEIGLNPWDVAAGSLLITEAGGLVGDLEGENQYLFGGEVIAANPRVFAQIVNLLAPYRAALASRTASAKK